MAKYKISGLPVIRDEHLVGILTNRDIRFEPDNSFKRNTYKREMVYKQGS